MTAKQLHCQEISNDARIHRRRLCPAVAGIVDIPADRFAQPISVPGSHVTATLQVQQEKPAQRASSRAADNPDRDMLGAGHADANAVLSRARASLSVGVYEPVASVQ
jgi:hypothetical protein